MGRGIDSVVQSYNRAMASSMDQLLAGATFNRPPSDLDFERLETLLGDRLPADFIAFMRPHDGGQHDFGEPGGIVGIWTSTEIVDGQSYMDTYCEPHVVDDERLVVFGGLDGEGYGFDRDGNVWMFPRVGGPDDGILQGTFLSFLERVWDDKVYD
jgi:hypothetical protein